MSIGQEIKEYRKMTGLTQQAFGRLMEVSGPTVSRWEKGIDEPTKENLAKIQEIVNHLPPLPPEECSYVYFLPAPGLVFELYDWSRRLGCEKELMVLLSRGATLDQLQLCCFIADNERLKKEIEALKGGE